MEQLQQSEFRRARWRRARGDLRLGGGEDEDWNLFGFESDPVVRLLILPEDPERSVLDLDEELWSLLGEAPDPVNGGKAIWGEDVPTSLGVLRCRARPGGELHRYLAVLRNGGLEMGLGSDASMLDKEGRRRFLLLTIVGRVWAALAAQTLLLRRTQLQGPWQVTLAMRETKEAWLVDFADGWSAPYWRDDISCPYVGSVAVTVELPTWPEGEAVRELAFRFGAWVEDAFGSKRRRFLSARGDPTGEFPSRGYHW